MYSKDRGILRSAHGISESDISIVFKNKEGNDLPLLGVNNYEAIHDNNIKNPKGVKLVDLGSTVTITPSGITTTKNSPRISKKIPIMPANSNYNFIGISYSLLVSLYTTTIPDSDKLLGGDVHRALISLGTTEARAAAVITPFAVSMVKKELHLTNPVKECDRLDTSGCAYSSGTIYVNSDYSSFVHEVAHELTFEYERQAEAHPLGKADVALKVWDVEMGPYIPVIKKSTDSSGKITYTWEDGTIMPQHGYTSPEAAIDANDKKEFVIDNVQTGEETWKDGTSKPRYGFMTPHGALNQSESISALAEACTDPETLASLLNPRSPNYKKEDADKIQFGLQWLVDMKYITPEALVRVMAAVKNWKPGKK